VKERWQHLSVLIAGCGSIGKRHARVLHDLGVQDVRACDPAETQRESLRCQVPSATLYDSYEAGLQDRPDTAFVCTPPELHVPMIEQALHAGCHVMCEKPLSTSVDGIDELEGLAATANRKVMVALCFRYHAGLVKARQYLKDGRIGRLVAVRALMGEHLPDVRPDYRDLFSSKHDGAFDLTHEVDLAVWYAGQKVSAVRSLSGSYSDIGIEAPDVAEILIGFEDRCLASIHLDFFQRPRRRQTELIGTGGVILIEFARWDRCTVSCYDTATQRWEEEQMATERDDMFRAEDREFLQAVAEDRPVACTIAEARRSVEIIATARQAARSAGEQI